MVAFVFNPMGVTPAQPYEARAAGWYPAKGIVDSETVPTAAGGEMLKISIAMADGGTVYHNFNVKHPTNQNVVDMAHQDLSTMFAALGIQRQINDTREFHGIPFDVKLRIEKSEGYDDKNVVSKGGFAPAGARADKYVRVPVAAAPAGMPFSAAPVQPQQQFVPNQYPAAQAAQPPGFQPAPNAHQDFQHPQAPQQPFQPPAPIQQQMPQAPQQFVPQTPFQQMPQASAQQSAPQQFQPNVQQFQQAPNQFAQPQPFNPNQPPYAQPR